MSFPVYPLGFIKSKGGSVNPDSFIFTINTALGDGIAEFDFYGVDPTGFNDYTVGWGDGDSDSYTGTQASIIHPYSKSGIYQITVTGVYRYISYAGSLAGTKIISIDNWGYTQFQTIFRAVQICTNLNTIAQPAVNTFSEATNANSCFDIRSGITSLDLSYSDLSNCATATAFVYINNSLTTLDMTGIQFPDGANLNLVVAYCPALTTVKWFDWVGEYSGSVGGLACALDETSVDELLVKADTYYSSNPPTQSLTINLSGGTSSAPGTAGDAAIISLTSIFSLASQPLTITTN